MRKFEKVLAFLLTLIIISGTMNLSAFAADDEGFVSAAGNSSGATVGVGAERTSNPTIQSDQTGEDALLVVWLVLLTASFIGLATVFAKDKRKKED